MEYSEAVKVLSAAVRSESRDHAFGDREVYWDHDGEQVASGYFGSGAAEVSVGGTTFKGEDAYNLATLGTTGIIGRNDETGPDTYNEGVILPALTADAVFQELTNRNE